MEKTKENNPAKLIEEEIGQQPGALNDLVSFYLSKGGCARFPDVPSSAMILFTGMGASYHAALAGSEMCCQWGVRSRVVEASDLSDWPASLFSQFDLIVYLSRSGANREVEPLLRMIEPSKLVAVTNDPDSLLGRAAAVVLPLMAGGETQIASKTYLNSLVMVWLLSRHLGHQVDGSEADQIKQSRKRIQVMVEARESLYKRWESLIGDEDKLILLGNGLQAVSARQSSMMLAEWSKVPAPAFSLKSFRHGFVELLEKGRTALVFQTSTRLDQTEEGYLQWMKTTGARVIRVMDGFPLELDEPYQPPIKIEYGLSTLIDTVSAQLLAIQQANLKHTAGFRYLSEVIR